MRVPPHGICDTHGGAEEGGDAKESDEDGGHLAGSVWLPGGLTVQHHTALWNKEITQELGSEVNAFIRSVRGSGERLTVKMCPTELSVYRQIKGKTAEAKYNILRLQCCLINRTMSLQTCEHTI